MVALIMALSQEVESVLLHFIYVYSLLCIVTLNGFVKINRNKPTKMALLNSQNMNRRMMIALKTISMVNPTTYYVEENDSHVVIVAE